MSTLISVPGECPHASPCRRAVSTLIARSPASFSGPGSAGNEMTSVALFIPRNWRLSCWMRRSVVSSTDTWPRKRTACCAFCRKRASVRGEGRRSDRLRSPPARFDAVFETGRPSGSRSGPRFGSTRIIMRGAAIERGPGGLMRSYAKVPLMLQSGVGREAHTSAGQETGATNAYCGFGARVGCSSIPPTPTSIEPSSGSSCCCGLLLS